MSTEMINILQAVLVAALTGGFAFAGVVYKTNKDESIRNVKADANFSALRTEIENSAQLQAQKSDYIVKEIKSDINRLEEKQEKYNNLQERTLRNSMKIDALHERLDNFEGR